MLYEEFLRRRLPELMRFAHVLCRGDSEQGTCLVVDVVARAFPNWSAVLAAGRPYSVLRTAVVRSRLGADGQRDRDRVEQAVLALALYDSQTPAEVAAVLESSVDEVEADLAAAAEHTTAGSLDELAAAAGTAPELVASAILDRLESAELPGAADIAFHHLISIHVPTDAPSAAVTAAGPGSRPGGASPVWAFDDEPEPTRRADVVPASGPPDLATPDAPPTRSAVVRRVVGTAAVALVAVTVCALAARTASGPTHAAATTGSTSGSPTRSASSASPGTPLLPGTRVLGRFYGSGGAKLAGGDHTPAPGRQLVLTGACSGPGGATIGPVAVAQCDGRPVGVAVTAAQARSLRITSDGSTTWRLVLADEPVHGTDGALRYPADPVLTSTSPEVLVAAGSGTGTSRVPLASSSTSDRVENVRLILTCTGSGVSFGSADHVFDDQYTRTCFRGWSYEFDVSGALLPGTLDVDASSDTSWRLVVVRA